MSALSSIFNRKFRKEAIAIVLVAATLGACNNYEEPVAEEPAVTPETEELAQEPSEAAEEYNVQIGELTGNVEEYLGQRVSVRGEAETAVGESAFLLQDDQLFGGEEVLVFNATTEPFLLPEDEPTDELQVTGEVRELNIIDFETDYGLVLDPELYAEYEDRPVIIAESIALSPDPEEISENPAAYYGQRIAVAGEVGEWLAPDTFTIQEEQLLGGEQVLVIGGTPGATLDEAEEVVITGVLRPYVRAEFEEEYDLTWDLDLQQQIEAEYTEEPVLVADGVYPSAQ